MVPVLLDKGEGRHGPMDLGEALELVLHLIVGSGL